jgi:hypothetical protein
MSRTVLYGQHRFVTVDMVKSRREVKTNDLEEQTSGLPRKFMRV